MDAEMGDSLSLTSGFGGLKPRPDKAERDRLHNAMIASTQAVDTLLAEDSSAGLSYNLMYRGTNQMSRSSRRARRLQSSTISKGELDVLFLKMKTTAILSSQRRTLRVRLHVEQSPGGR